MYPAFYNQLNIEQTIQQFGPQNRYKEEFENTNPTQHAHYFSQITAAINNHGEGLNEITYSVRGNEVPLLREAEIVHLQDVANLIDTLMRAAAVSTLVLCLTLIYLFKRRRRPPNAINQLSVLLTVMILITLGMALIGFERVFYWLHEVIFPANHQWFFYYQDSLMSTMMQAPNLFGPIALLLILLNLSIFVMVNMLISKTAAKLGA